MGKKEEIFLPLLFESSPCPPASPAPPAPLPSKTVVVNYARYKLMIEITLNLHFWFPSAYPQERTILRKGYALKSEFAGILS
jgi:hypothetical protein